MARPEGKYAWTVTVGTKGQIVLPKEARDVFDIKPGDTLIILGDKDQGMAIPPKNQFSDFYGCIAHTIRKTPLVIIPCGYV